MGRPRSRRFSSTRGAASSAEIASCAVSSRKRGKGTRGGSRWRSCSWDCGRPWLRSSASGSHLFQREAHDIELEIVERFIAQIRRIDLGRVACLAATLVRNTERDLVDARVRERARAAKCDAVTPDALAAPDAVDEPPPASPFGLPAGQSDVAHVAGLRRWLLSAVGPDADLIVDAVIHGRSRLDLAASRGISHAAARKRLERALARARHALIEQTQSQPAATAAWVS